MSLVAALLVLCSAMLDPKAAAVIAVLFLVGDATYQLLRSRFP